MTGAVPVGEILDYCFRQTLVYTSGVRYHLLILPAHEIIGHFSRYVLNDYWGHEKPPSNCTN